MRRVAVTGLGIISPTGKNPADFFNNLMSAKSAVKRISEPFAEKLSIKISAPADFNVSDYFHGKGAWSLDRVTQMALVAASQAWNDSGLSLTDEEKLRTGVYMGTGMGGSQSLEDVNLSIYVKKADRVSPLSVVKIMNNASASHISIEYKLFGPCLTFSTACSASSVAIGEAFHRIKYGSVDRMLAGGTESILQLASFKCWESMRVLALEDPEDPSASCKPFSKNRTGFVLGEGAAVIVMEEMEAAKKRGAKIYGEVIGYSSTCDAHHITSPSVEGQVRAMNLAFDDAKISTDDIDYINAHGTATEINDLVETQALKKVFSEQAYKIPVSSTKSMHGHLIGAGGAVEFIASILAIKNKAVPPTANLKVPDPECDLDYVPNVGRHGVKVRTVMSNSFAFGGTNAVLIIKEV
ncbi:MAG: beta-ketoacyl-[acyl-carrier-protein] synthase family protein [Nitrospiraceae bacterium]|nr:beta-ketoacyl-[acyl-carrier-protein] synthase family protein [Nitrospiraceae bacterium]